MPLHKTQKTITYLEIFDHIPLVTDSGSNSNSALFIEEVVLDEYQEVAAVYESGMQRLFVKGRTLRFTPVNGMTYAIQEGT